LLSPAGTPPGAELNRCIAYPSIAIWGGNRLVGSLGILSDFGQHRQQPELVQILAPHSSDQDKKGAE
jgi:hypothetical protein